MGVRFNVNKNPSKQSLTRDQSTKELTDRSSSDSAPSASSHSKQHRDSLKNSKAVGYGRFIFIFFLLLLAAILGSAAFIFLSREETTLAESQFITINERALNAAASIAYRKFLGGQAIAKVISYALPDAEPWPFVAVPGYNDMIDSIGPTSLAKGLNFAPIVLPEQAEEWEAFAQEEYHKFFGNDTITAGVSSFGFGMWAKDKSIDTPDHRFHEISGETSWGSPNQILVPKMHHAFYGSPLLLFQAHYPRPHGTAIDSVIDCAKTRAASDDDPTSSVQSCGTISELTYSNAPERGPGGLVVMPVYPANDPTTLTGFIIGFLHWQEMLEEIFAKDVYGIDCVLSAADKTYTYEIMDGVPVFKGEGDSHDRRHDEQGVTAVLVSSDPEETKLPLNNSTYTYTLSIYPNQKLYDSYSTSNPQTACITAVFAIVLTSLLFVLYDFFVHRDISKKKNLLEAKRQFVRFVSHEVRTPLNSVCMGLVLLQEEIALSLGYKSTEALLKAEKEDRVVQGAASKKQGDKVIIAKSLDWFDLAHEVQVNARSGVDVLNDLLNYDKIESNTLTLELTVVPIWELIESTVYEFKVPSATKKIDLKLKLPTDGDAHLKLKLPNGDADDWKQHPKDAVAQKVIGDSVRITQVLRNLVSNALKFTPEDGNLYVEAQWIHHRDTTATKPIEMEFELKNHETIVAPCSGMLEIKVTDTGAGMSPEQLARLFQKGVQFNVNELQAGNGSGLGLFIAKGIVEQHGGSLTCSSQGLGKGTTFTMSIPLYNLPDPEKSSGDIEDGANMDMSFEERSLRVLIVDDATSNRKLLRRLLQNRQHVCDECEDGQQAVEKVIEAEAKSDPFDVILLDYEMPVMNGPTAAREIRKLGCDAFLVGITGNLMAEDVEYFRSMGANAVLPKPFSIKALEELMIENDVGGGKEDTGAGMFRVSSNTQLEIAGEMVTLSQRYDTDEGMNDSLSSSKMTALAERFGVDASMDIDTSDALSF